MQQVQTAARRLADRTSAEILALWAQLEANEITSGRFRAAAVAVIARANAAGIALADLGLAAEVTRQLGRPRRPVGLSDPVATDQDRVGASVDRATTGDDAPASLDRLARSEPLITVANTVQAGMVAHGASGWTRMLTGTSCPLCTRWADGVVRPPTVRMGRHPGCDCLQAPVFTTS